MNKEQSIQSVLHKLSATPIKVEFAAKWLQIWEAETDKGISVRGIVPILERFISEYKQDVNVQNGVAKKMQPFIESAKELGATNIVADINEQLQFNKELANKAANVIQALDRALQIARQN